MQRKKSTEEPHRIPFARSHRIETEPFTAEGVDLGNVGKTRKALLDRAKALEEKQRSEREEQDSRGKVMGVGQGDRGGAGPPRLEETSGENGEEEGRNEEGRN